MLAPHHREDAELDQVRLAAERGQQQLVFIRTEPVLGHELGRDAVSRSLRARRDVQCSVSTSERNSLAPSVPESATSARRSGCGIRPSTCARLVVDAGDVVARAVGIGLRGDGAARLAIAEGDAAFAFEPLERGVVGEVAAVLVGDRESDDLAALVAARVDRIVPLDAQSHVAADEFERGVAHQHAGQQPRLGQHLEAVADAEHRGSGARARHHFAHDRRMRRHGAGAEIIAVGEAARQHDQIACRQHAVAVPDHGRRLARGGFERDRRVAVAIRSGKDDDARFHAAPVRCVMPGESRDPRKMSS